MNLADMSDYQLHTLRAQVDAEQQRRYRDRADSVLQRLEQGSRFDDDELIYAAAKRCTCGAGMAYPKGIGMHGFWECSDLLTHRAQPGGKPHTQRLSFAAYEIPTEKMRSMGGASTRPALVSVSVEGA